MTTIGEEIEAWIQEYESGDEYHKNVMRETQCLECFKALKLKEYIFSVNNGKW